MSSTQVTSDLPEAPFFQEGCCLFIIIDRFEDLILISITVWCMQTKYFSEGHFCFLYHYFIFKAFGECGLYWNSIQSLSASSYGIILESGRAFILKDGRKKVFVWKLGFSLSFRIQYCKELKYKMKIWDKETDHFLIVINIWLDDLCSHRQGTSHFMNSIRPS